MREVFIVIAAIMASLVATGPARSEGCGPPHGPAAEAVEMHGAQDGIGDMGVCVFYGDYTADGKDDVFAVYYSQGDGNSFSVSGHVFRNGGDGRYFAEGSTELFGLEPRDVTFSLHQVDVTMTVPRDGDPRCCPTGFQRFSFPMD